MRRKSTLLAPLCAALASLSAASVHAQIAPITPISNCSQRIRTVSTNTPIADYTAHVSSGDVIEMTSLSAGSSPVMRVSLNGQHWTITPNSLGTVRFIVPSGISGYAKIIAHSRSNAESGHANLWVDGTLRRSAWHFGGTHLNLCAGYSGKHTEISLTHAPAGPEQLSILAARASSTGEYYDYARRSQDAAHLSFTGKGTSSPSPFYTTQTTHVIVGTSDTTRQNDNTQVVLQRGTFDAESDGDSDNDGLSNGVERELLTCHSDQPGTQNNAGFDCSMYHSMDSDQDGISDKDELFGVRFEGKALQFPRWGAKPAAKDVFIHPVMIYDNDTDYGANTLRNTLTQQLSELINDANGTQSIPSGRHHFLRDHVHYFRSQNENSLRNPDFSHRIRFHFDTPELPQQRSFQEMDGFLFDSNSPSRVYYSPTSCNDVTRGASVLHSSIRRYFIESCLTQSGSGGASRPSSDSRGPTGYHANFNSLIPIHELGHALGLEHGGVDTIAHKPNYVSEMCYDYEHQIGGDFSDGSRPTLRSQELDETVSITEKWKAKLSTRSNPSYNIITINGEHYVDWNRDEKLETGVRSPVSRRLSDVRSSFFNNHLDPNRPNGHNTHYTHEIQSPFAIVKTPKSLLVLQARDGTIYGSEKQFYGECPGDISSGPTCGFTNSEADPTEIGAGTSVAAAYAPIEEKVVVVTRDDNDLLISLLGQGTLTTIHTIEDAKIDGAADIEVSNGNVHVVWKNKEKVVMHTFGPITSPSDIRTFETGIESETSPSLSRYLKLGDDELFMIFNDGGFQFAKLSSGDAWESTGFAFPPNMETYYDAGQSRVAFQWVPDKKNPTEKYEGRWLVVFKKKSNEVRMMMIRQDAKLTPFYADWGPSGEIFSKEKGDLYAELSQAHDGGNVVGIVVRPNSDAGKWNVYTYPYADGIIPHAMQDYDDMSLVDLCRLRTRSFGETGCGPCKPSTPGSCSYN